MFFNTKDQSLSPMQVNDALDSLSELYHPRIAARLREKINVCVQWTSKVADISDAKNCFRNLGTFSQSLSHNFPVFTTKHGKASENLSYQDWMSTLHEARRKELGSERVHSADDTIELAGGRLLVVEPWGSTWTGVGKAETGEFFDINDFPPIGLWVAYIATPKIISATPKEHPPYFSDDGFVLCYIPRSFIEMVQSAIDVNCEECIYWLEDQVHVSAKIIASWSGTEK